MMVHAPRGKVLAGVVVEHASVVFKLVYQEGAQRRSSGIEGQSSTKNRGASAGGHIGGRIRGGGSEVFRGRRTHRGAPGKGAGGGPPRRPGPRPPQKPPLRGLR